MAAFKRSSVAAAAAAAVAALAALEAARGDGAACARPPSPPAPPRALPPQTDRAGTRVRHRKEILRAWRGPRSGLGRRTEGRGPRRGGEGGGGEKKT